MKLTKIVEIIPNDDLTICPYQYRFNTKGYIKFLKKFDSSVKKLNTKDYRILCKNLNRFFKEADIPHTIQVNYDGTKSNIILCYKNNNDSNLYKRNFLIDLPNGLILFKFTQIIEENDIYSLEPKSKIKDGIVIYNRIYSDENLIDVNDRLIDYLNKNEINYLINIDYVDINNTFYDYTILLQNTPDNINHIKDFIVNDWKLEISKTEYFDFITSNKKFDL